MVDSKQQQQKVAIVGYREFTDYKTFKHHILTSVEPEKISQVISGGARGTDQLAKRFAAEYHIPLKEHKADWKLLGVAAGPIRNQKIAKECQLLIAFDHPKSKGTKQIIKAVNRINKRVIVIDLDVDV